MADAVSCTLSRGKKSANITFDLELNDQDEAKEHEDTVYDLFFDLQVETENGKDSLNTTIFSVKAEDEVGQENANFETGDEAKLILEEALTGAPDGRDYTLKCEYLPTAL